MTARQGSMLGWAIVLNLAMLLLGPFAGSTIIDALIALGGSLKQILNG